MLNKKLIGHNVRELRKGHGLSGERFGQKIGITKSALSQIESGSISPSLELLSNIALNYGSSLDVLIGRTSQNKQNGNISLVTAKTRTGYLSDIDTRQPSKNLPEFCIPGLTNGHFRAFEVEGISMLTAEGVGFYPGDIVVTQFCPKPEYIQDSQVYVIVHNTDGVDEIIFKRCFYHSEKSGEGVIRCDSDNRYPPYPPVFLNVKTVREIWEFKRKITAQAPEPSGILNRLNYLEDRLSILEQQNASKD